MHAEVVQFLAGCVEVEWSGATVYEVGSRDVNGQARDSVPQTFDRWVGFDVRDGNGVDHVGDAAELLPAFDHCDVAVSTEVLEHAANWRDIVKAMCDRLRPGGWLVVTCAGNGRKPHGADGGAVGPDEHYANVALHELSSVAVAAGVEMVRGEEGGPGDTRYLGRKR